MWFYLPDINQLIAKHNSYFEFFNNVSEFYNYYLQDDKLIGVNEKKEQITLYFFSNEEQITITRNM